MPFSPCDQFPVDLAALPQRRAAHSHAVHHVVGRIWRRRPPPFAMLGPPDPQLRMEGCETHASNFRASLNVAPLRPHAPFMLAPLLLAGGIPFAAPGLWLVALHFLHAGARKHHTGHPIPVAEPDSALLLLGALLALLPLQRRRP